MLNLHNGQNDTIPRLLEIALAYGADIAHCGHQIHFPNDRIEFVHGRAEDIAMQANMRGKFDTVVSRAVANMRMLSEWCLPFLKVGGYFLAIKGPLAEQELDDAKRAITILGGKIEGVFEAKIPYTNLSHKIIIVKKVRQTPPRFPRKPALATKTPIEQCYKMKK